MSQKPIVTIEVTSPEQFHALWEALTQYVQNHGEYIEVEADDPHHDPAKLAKEREKLAHVEAAMHQFDNVMEGLAR